MTLVQDPKIDWFPCFTVGGKVSEQRRVVAEHGLAWIRAQYACGRTGCVVFDIDDTLVNGNESVRGGFEFMVSMYDQVRQYFPVHIVTARPHDTRAKTMEMLRKRGILVDPDRLHMMNACDWESGEEDAFERFKWDCYVKCHRTHGYVVARFGDKLWDVAHIQSLHSYLEHVGDDACCLFYDPYMRDTLSGKLPGHG